MGGWKYPSTQRRGKVMNIHPTGSDASSRAKNVAPGRDQQAMNGLAGRRSELADWSMVALCLIAAVIFGSLLSRVVERLHKIGLPPPVSAIGLVAITGLTIFIFIDSLLGP